MSMADAQHKAFAKLRPSCVALSSAALKLRSQQASIKTVLSLLEDVYSALYKCSEPNILDAKLAQYAFFPLSNIFNVAQKLSSRCLEVAVRSLHILVLKGWGRNLEPDMGKQLLILMSLLSGRSPANSSEQAPSEELICACFECMTSLAGILGKSKQNVFDEPGAKTTLDQSVYMLLEAVSDNPSEIVQFSALFTLRAVFEATHSRVLLASVLPRTVSALTRVVTPTTQMRRRARILTASLHLLTFLLKAVLADAAVLDNGPTEEKIEKGADDALVLDEKWLRATASQIKLALANAIKHRAHEKEEVREALFSLCMMVCEFCSQSLVDSLPLMLNTAVILADPTQESSRAHFYVVKRLILTNPDLEYYIRDSLNKWVGRLPQVVHGHDEKPKCLLLRQISTSISILLEMNDPSSVLDDGLAVSLVQSLATEIDQSNKRSIDVSDSLSITQPLILDESSKSQTFPSLLLDQRSQIELSVELNGLISRIKSSAQQPTLTRYLLASVADSNGSRKLSALYLCLNLLKADQSSPFSLADLIDVPDEQDDSTASLISDLYCLTLPILLDSSTTSQQKDWRVTALALESTILQAQQLRKLYRPELIDTLYPTLALFGSSEPRLQTHAVTALNILARACQYSDAATMLIDNVDYLINSIALRLNSFDLSPQGPLVLLMMLRLCGARILPYLDDMIGSIFVALDNFHGYPLLVELLFKVLSGVVDEAVKSPQLALMSSTEAPKHTKQPYQPSTISDILSDVRAHKAKREARKAEAQADQDRAPSSPAPHQPWSTLDAEPSPSNPSTPPPEPSDPEPPPLPKPHSLLLSIARSTIPHLASPSPAVRLTLLTLLTNLAPLLSTHENTFLPLINDLWPALLPRLFSPTTTTNGDGDPAFVTAAALSLLSALCRGAGSFLASRTTPILPRLEETVRSTRLRLERGSALFRRPPIGRSQISGSNSGKPGGERRELLGTVDLRIVPVTSSYSEHGLLTPSVPPTPDPLSSSFSSPSALRDLYAAAVRALAAVVGYVGITAAEGDGVLEVLGPVVVEVDSGHGDKEREGLREEVREALEWWNADALWEWERRWKKGEKEHD